MTFEWDEEKERHNIQALDGITFSYAARVFLDSKRIEKLMKTILKRKNVIM